MCLKRLVLSAAIATSFIGGPAALAETEITMAVTDVAGLEQLRREWGPFVETLESQSDFTVEFAPVSSRTAAVELLRSERVDFVLTGPAEYIVMRELTGAEPVLGFSRPEYFSGIVTMADSGIETVEDLKGGTVALSDIGSTSGHLAPAQVLADNGIDPQTDITIMHTAERIGYESLKRGDVEAWGANYVSDFIGLRDQDDETPPGAFRVIARGPDLPNDVMVAGTHVDTDVVSSFRDVIVENSSRLIDAIVNQGGEENQKYRGMRFIANINDSSYDYVRQAYGSIGQDRFDQFVGD
jgi:phosphonate transport system substrate-binding protein